MDIGEESQGEGLPEKGTSEKRPEGKEGASYTKIEGRAFQTEDRACAKGLRQEQDWQTPGVCGFRQSWCPLVLRTLCLPLPYTSDLEVLSETMDDTETLEVKICPTPSLAHVPQFWREAFPSGKVRTHICACNLGQKWRAPWPEEDSSQPHQVSQLQTRQGLAPLALNVPPRTTLSGQICKWPSGRWRGA